jgi:TonB family protein
MTKNLTLLIFSLLFFQAAQAQNDTIRMYLKNSGRIVDNTDSADFVRLILPPDTIVDKNLYRVFEYYPNGKYKLVATSLSGTSNLILDGTCITYFPNGIRQTVIQYKDGKIVDNILNYYPNGKLYSVLRWDYNYYDYNLPSTSVRLMECRDSTGRILALNGKGHFLMFDDYFTTIVEEGDINDGKRDGEWRGLIADSGRYICTYHKGELKSGISYIRSGHTYPFKQFTVYPVFDEGGRGFHEFVKRNLVYPDFAKQHKISKTIHVGFIVNADGTVSNLKIVNGDVPCLNDEALRIMRLCPVWTPGYKYGFPVSMAYDVPIDFYIDKY